MNLANLCDQTLLENTKSLATKERQTTLDVLRHLREVERRSLYAELAYSSLFEYAVKELKYSAGAAQRRIMSMRVLNELPEIEEKVELGELSLSTLSQAQSFFRVEKSGIAEKREILFSLENKTSREVERELVSRASEPLALRPEKLRAVSVGHSELKVLLEEKLLKEIEELKGYLAHKIPHASIKDVLAYAIGCGLKECRPKAPKSSTLTSQNVKNNEAENAINVNDNHSAKIHTPIENPGLPKEPSRYVPVEIKRQVWARDGGRCEFVNPATGLRCSSTHKLELDHIYPYSLGGESTLENLRLRCHTHNQLAAIKVFGTSKMSHFVNRLNSSSNVLKMG